MGAPRTARALLAAAALASTVPALASSAEAPGDPEARAALSLVYDGDFHGAESRLAALARERAADPVLPYLQALALEWRLEQDPATARTTPRCWRSRTARWASPRRSPGRDPADRRALLARGAAHGVKSRLHLFRWEKGPASREAVRMREALVAARDAGETALDLDFGLGLYDYYADTLPRFFKVVAFVLRIPGGDRERGMTRSPASRAGAAPSTTTRRACRCTTCTPSSRGSPTAPCTGSARCGASTRGGRSGA